MRNVWLSNSDEHIRSEERRRSTKFFPSNVWSFLIKKIKYVGSSYRRIQYYSTVHKQIQEYDQNWKRSPPRNDTGNQEDHPGGRKCRRPNEATDSFWMENIRRGRNETRNHGEKKGQRRGRDAGTGRPHLAGFAETAADAELPPPLPLLAVLATSPRETRGRNGRPGQFYIAAALRAGARVVISCPSPGCGRAGREVQKAPALQPAVQPGGVGGRAPASGWANEGGR